jgi:hypothetical protein
MKEGTVGNSNNWMDGWMESQQKYWNAWADMAQRGMKAPEAPKNPLADGLNQWWQAVSPMTPPTGRDVFDRLMDVSKGYYSMAERFMSGAQGNKDGGMDAINGWLDHAEDVERLVPGRRRLPSRIPSSAATSSRA